MGKDEPQGLEREGSEISIEIRRKKKKTNASFCCCSLPSSSPPCAFSRPNPPTRLVKETLLASTRLSDEKTRLPDMNQPKKETKRDAPRGRERGEERRERGVMRGSLLSKKNETPTRTHFPSFSASSSFPASKASSPPTFLPSRKQVSRCFSFRCMSSEHAWRLSGG